MLASHAAPIRTTDGAIALHNLEAQIEGREHQAARGTQSSRFRAELVDLVMLRAQILGRIADYERAQMLAERQVDNAPADPLALLARARTRGSLHRFVEALADLETAEGLGLKGRELDVETAAVLQAMGRYEEAWNLRKAGEERYGDFESLAGLASLHAELKRIEEAEPLFDECYGRYRGVSPFPIAMLEFQRGHMWLGGADLDRARHWFHAAWRRLPSYAQAECHLAEVKFELGERDDAIARLRRLAAHADDPDYAAQLARMLAETGRPDEAKTWREHAERGYDGLVLRHPAAFADHAAGFWLSVGDDPPRALRLAELNHEVRDTPRARALLERARRSVQETRG
jgi:tetratricopeptide (TPR) repeat protein